MSTGTLARIFTKRMQHASKKYLLDNIAKVFEITDSVLSAYVYGSFIFNEKNANDLDLLVIIKNTQFPVVIMDSLSVKIKRVSKKIKFDLNYIFSNELDQNLCGQKSTFYYLYVLRTGLLIYGENSLEKVNPSKNDLYRWVVLLSQRARHFHYNQIEINFWVSKFKKWSIYALAEAYYYQDPAKHPIEPDLRNMARKFVRENHFQEGKALFLKRNLDSKYYCNLLEKLRLFIENRILNLQEHTG